MAIRHRVLHHGDRLECEHEGLVSISPSGGGELANKDEVLTDRDLLERATIACPASTPCTKVITLLQGPALHMVARCDEIPLISNLISLTDSGATLAYDREKALRRLLKEFLLRPDIEGIYSNDPKDPGGETMKGITWSTWKEVAPQVNLPVDHARFLQMSDSDWDAIFTHSFWEKLNLDKIEHPGVALMTGDFYFNSRAHAVTHMQRLLNTAKYGKSLPETGTLGPKTVQAINEVDGDELLDDYSADRQQFLDNFVNAHPRFRGLRTRTGKLSAILQRFIYASPARPVFTDQPLPGRAASDARLA